ncbi:phosphotransferase enzyme family protein [Rhodoligotrophos defluvii]|uniref:phosphotransferase enzyme family protein n=1 Tax=Rhodoligotrophos defluvii TaxID=2561934 RepID=UPI0010C9FB52|nr:phosphotransferase [Rhodoligotrophos defluvii]
MAPNVTPEIRTLLERLKRELISRLATFGKSSDRYGLIHADMRLANLLIDDGMTRLIDFDDCGFGWFLYDFAAGVSFIEDHPQVPALKAAWVKGYRSCAAAFGGGGARDRHLSHASAHGLAGLDRLACRGRHCPRTCADLCRRHSTAGRGLSARTPVDVDPSSASAKRA